MSKKTEPDAHEPSTAMAGIAALMPMLFFGSSCGLYGVTLIGVGPGGGASVTEAIREMGLPGFALVGASGLMGAVGAGICLFLAGRGKRVPAAVTLAMAVLPWLTGLAATAAGLSMVWDALAHVDPASRATMMAGGIAQATQAELYGGVLGSALCAGVAFGMAVAALGQRAPERSAVGALIGGALALPVLGLALWGAWAARMSGLVLAIAAMGAVVASAIGGAGIGADEPRGRSGALGAAVPVAALLAVVLAAEAALSGSFIEIFAALAGASPEMRGILLAAGVAEVRPVDAAATWALPVGSLLVLGLAGWAVAKSRPSAGRIAGAGALAFVALSAVGAHAAVNGWAQRQAAAMTDRPWGEAGDFEPVRVASSDDPEPDLRLLLRPRGLTQRDGDPVAPQTRNEMREALRQRVARAPQPRVPGHGFDRPARLAVAVDRRVDAVVLRAFFGALADAEVPSVALAGTSASSLRARDAAEVASVYPAVGAALEGQGRCRVLVAGALSPGAFERDEARRRVTIGAEAPDRFEASSEVDTDLSPRGPSYSYEEPDPLWATLADDATGASLVETCDRARRHDLQLVVFVRDREP